MAGSSSLRSIVLVARSTLTVHSLQSCIERNGLSSWVEQWGCHAQRNASGDYEGYS